MNYRFLSITLVSFFLLMGGYSYELVEWADYEGSIKISNGQSSNERFTYKKNHNKNTWDSGFRSVKVMEEDGELIAKIPYANSRLMVGLTKAQASKDFKNYDCAVYYDKGRLQVFEFGRYRKTVGNYQPDDFIKISREDGVFSVFTVSPTSGTQLLFTSNYKYSTAPMYAGVSFHDFESEIVDTYGIGFTPDLDTDFDGLLDTTEDAILDAIGGRI